MAAGRKMLDRVMTRRPHQFLLTSSHRSGDKRRYLSGDNRQYLTGGMLFRQQQLPLKLGGELMTKDPVKNEFKVLRCKGFMDVWSSYRQLSTTVKPTDDDDDGVKDDDDDDVVVKDGDDDFKDGVVVVEDGDFLGAEKLGKKFLMRSCSSEEVPIESLRGKIVGLYFDNPYSYFQPPEIKISYAFREFYYTLKQAKPDSFEMIYVPPLPLKHYHQEEDEDPSVGNGNIHLPLKHYHQEEEDEDEDPSVGNGNIYVPHLSPKHYHQEADEDPSVHNAMISTLPWLSIPIDDLQWRSYLHQVYNPYSTDITFIDTRNNKVEVLLSAQTEDNMYRYGPHFYPFTQDRLDQLEVQTEQLGKETSIQAILGSSSRDYLIDRHSNKVPISSLQNKNVLLFGYSSHPTSESYCFEQLLQIYKRFRNHNLEIVSIIFDFNGGNEERQQLWMDHLAHIPWLSLPFGDEKIWLLRAMAGNVFEDCVDTVLFVKPKGESLLDPYGCQVLEAFGNRAFPYSRKAAAEYLLKRLKRLSFKSYVDNASELGLDFNSLIQNKDGGGIEHVSLSTILEGKARGILLLFANLGTCSPERLKSLISIYQSQNESSSSSFEVIFVSLDKDAPSFNKHFSSMPWFAFQRPINRREHRLLAQGTTKMNFNGHGYFLAFGADQLGRQAGLITKTFENSEFPFINDAESVEHVAFRVGESLYCKREADGTPCYDGDGWWSGIEYKSDYHDPWMEYNVNQMEDSFYTSSVKNGR